VRKQLGAKGGEREGRRIMIKEKQEANKQILKYKRILFNKNERVKNVKYRII